MDGVSELGVRERWGGRRDRERVGRQVFSICATDAAVVGKAAERGIVAWQGRAVVIRHRSKLSASQVRLDALMTELLPRMRCRVALSTARQATRAACTAAGMPAGPGHARPFADITALFDRFVGIGLAPSERIRFASVPARLICTRRGTGTQNGVSSGGEQPAGTVTASRLLRKAGWPGNQPSRPPHRSPNTTDSGVTRRFPLPAPQNSLEDDR